MENLKNQENEAQKLLIDFWRSVGVGLSALAEACKLIGKYWELKRGDWGELPPVQPSPDDIGELETVGKVRGKRSKILVSGGGVRVGELPKQAHKTSKQPVRNDESSPATDNAKEGGNDNG